RFLDPAFRRLVLRRTRSRRSSRARRWPAKAASAHDLAAAGMALRLQALGQAEIGDLRLEGGQGRGARPALAGGARLAAEQAAGGLEVPVDDAGLVGGADRPGQQGDEGRGLGGRLRRAGDARLQVTALNVLQAEPGAPLLLPGLEDLHDV